MDGPRLVDNTSSQKTIAVFRRAAESSGVSLMVGISSFLCQKKQPSLRFKHGMEILLRQMRKIKIENAQMGPPSGGNGHIFGACGIVDYVTLRPWEIVGITSLISMVIELITSFFQTILSTLRVVGRRNLNTSSAILIIPKIKKFSFSAH